MTRPSPRTGFNRPRLIRLLADLVAEDGTGTKHSFAERLGQWLDLTDAIALSGALSAGAGAPAAGASPAAAGAGDALARVRAALADSVAADGVAGEGRARIRLPVPGGGATLDGVDFLPYRRYYVAHQRDMEASIGPLRTTVREALAANSAPLARLAALDAAMEKILGERERILLAAVPQLLERRFERLRAAYRQSLAETGPADDPARWLSPGGWLAAFRHDLQRFLLAELEFRLLPVEGLVAALGGGRPATPPETAADAGSASFHER